MYFNRLYDVNGTLFQNLIEVYSYHPNKTDIRIFEFGPRNQITPFNFEGIANYKYNI